ncbi:phage shock protein E [Cricetibacter osteomyelitidis]|uniref:Phage shock protein E n=1 Tax=Cricetibacter osteomyelitidis TaxID=1521931 RepID=A0A4R2SSN5_9PAST|nr:rhodanese-like domain-containing protein [Cricetibacter osteomyelitidis]TCP93329.1 phage shock protein E [Cricetibacter osteomyelitidis]
MKKWLFVAISSVAALMTMPTQAETQEQLQMQTQKAAGVWIDVRSAEEFNSGHIQGALNIAHDKLAAEIAQIEPNKNAPINVYCRSGRRAELALIELKNLGYTNVINHGSYEDLRKQEIQ